MSGWQSIETAPYNQPVRIRAGHMTFVARLIPDASINSDEQSCDQWQAEHEGEHPPCWSGGACWESNENECRSLQPEVWQPLTTEATLRAENELMREALNDAPAAINAAFVQADAEYRDHDKTAARHDAVVRAFREKVRNALAQVAK